jgi:hypothetical protein
LQTQFVDHYGLCFEGLNPKRLKVPRDITLKDVSRIFGPIVYRNGYNYVHNEDPLQGKDLVDDSPLETIFACIKIDSIRHASTVNI